MNEKLYEELNRRINTLIGMATVPACKYPDVKSVHKGLLELAWYLDEEFEKLQR